MELVLLTHSSGRKVTRFAHSSARKWTSLFVVLEGKYPRLLVVYPKWLSRMYVLAFGPLPSASQNDDASTGLVPGLKLTKMRVRTFWTAPMQFYVENVSNSDSSLSVETL